MYDIMQSMFSTYSVWTVILGIMAMVKRQQEPPEWRERGLTREQQILENAQYQTYRKEVYKNYPRLEMFEQNKKIWAFFLTLVYFITYVLNILAVIETDGVSATPPGILSVVVCFLVLIGGSTIVLSVFLVAMGPNWKLAFLLYVIGIGQIIMRIYTFIDIGMDSWDKFWLGYSEGFRIHPAVFGADILAMVFNVFILLTAVWLTALKRNRKIAELSDALDRKTKYDFMAERIEMDTDMDID